MSKSLFGSLKTYNSMTSFVLLQKKLIILFVRIIGSKLAKTLSFYRTSTVWLDLNYFENIYSEQSTF